MILGKENAVADWRALIGPTDAKKAKITHPHRLSFLITMLLLLFQYPYRFFVFSFNPFCIPHIYSCHFVHVINHHKFICFLDCMLEFPIIIFSSVFSIRAMCGTNSEKNCVHGSDSPQSAQREISFFFKEKSAGKLHLV